MIISSIVECNLMFVRLFVCYALDVRSTVRGPVVSTDLVDWCVLILVLDGRYVVPLARSTCCWSRAAVGCVHVPDRGAAAL